MFYLEILLGKALLLIIKIIDKKRGTNIIGETLLKFDRNFISKFNIDTSKVIVITGTNGKSTVTNLVAHIFKTSNKTVISNLEGANLIGGIATVLIKNCTIKGNFKDAIFIFEVDERTLPLFLENIKAKNLAITNIQKDQVCRNGDPDYIYQLLKKVISKDMTVFLNNNDPNSKALENLSNDTIYYGVNKNESSYTLNKKDTITMPCPICYNKIVFDYYNISNIGKFHCMNCDFESDKNIKYAIKNVDFDKQKFTICNEIVKMTYIEPFTLYSYALAFALADYFGIKNIGNKFDTFKNIDGRLEVLKYKDKQIKYIRIKQENPETLQNAIDSVAQDKKEKVVILGLCLLKDFKPYYSNTFYSYDCDFSNIINSNVEKYICFSEAVAYDTANRLIYAGVNKEKIEIINNDNVEQILQKIDKCKSDNIHLITWLHTYEDINKKLKKEGE